MEKYAYIRVSTKEQNIDRQLVALKPYGIPEQNIYCDYQSGKDFDRPAYKKLLGKLKRGDLLIVKSIDRLGKKLQRDFSSVAEHHKRHRRGYSCA